MTPIKVLVVDDAAVVRRVLQDVLSSDSELEVVGSAIHGQAALDMLDDVDPDIVVLDVSAISHVTDSNTPSSEV